MQKVYADDISTFFEPASTFPTVADLINVLTRNVFTIAGVICLIILIVGGFSVIMGAGGGDSKRMESGKKAITGAVVGLIVIVTSVWIIQIIETITGLSILSSGV